MSNENIFDNLGEFFRDMWNDLAIGPAPEINKDHMVSSSISRGAKWKVTNRINKLLAMHPDRDHKFGKSGQPPYRIKMDDYRGAPYTTMFLLFESISPEDVSEMEVNYIKRHKHLKNNKNVSEARGHKMRSLDGKYHFYLVL